MMSDLFLYRDGKFFIGKKLGGKRYGHLYRTNDGVTVTLPDFAVSNDYEKLKQTLIERIVYYIYGAKENIERIKLINERQLPRKDFKTLQQIQPQNIYYYYCCDTGRCFLGVKEKERDGYTSVRIINHWSIYRISVGDPFLAQTINELRISATKYLLNYIKRMEVEKDLIEKHTIGEVIVGKQTKDVLRKER